MPFRHDRLLGIVEARGWKAADLARASQLGEDQISRYLRGRAPRPDGLVRLANALDITSDYLFDNDNRFEGVPFPRAAAVLSLERYCREGGIPPEDVLRLKQVAEAHSAPPLSCREWAQLHESLTILRALAPRHQKKPPLRYEPPRRLRPS